jgi:hypothetical protein
VCILLFSLNRNVVRSVVDQFIKIMQAHEIVNFAGREQRRSSVIGGGGSGGGGASGGPSPTGEACVGLDDFFPFDPYTLRHSRACVTKLCFGSFVYHA